MTPQTLRAYCCLVLWLVLSSISGALAQTGFVISELPGGESTAPVLYREALVPPTRYRVIFVPGSGCAGMMPISDRYFRGLLHAEVLVLNKPGVDLMAWPAPKECTPEFVRWDALGHWATVARTVLKNNSSSHSQLPQILIGASEGAEIIPALIEVVPNLHALVLISSSGLDPRETGELQARRLDSESTWRDIGIAVSSSQHDDIVYQGRTLRYWRHLWSWKVATPLLATTVPVMQVWGDADALVPESAYKRFSELAAARDENAARTNQVCFHRLEGADHGLQSSSSDGVQWLWAQLERWARTPGESPCSTFDADSNNGFNTSLLH